MVFTIHMWKCLLAGVILFLILLLALVILVRIAVLKLTNYYVAINAMDCNNTYLPWLPLPQPVDAYNPYLAQALMTASYNVSLSNCTSPGPLPVPAGFKMTQINGTSAGDIPRMFAYVFVSQPEPTTVMIVFTGTIFLDEWVMDLDLSQTTPTSGDLNNLVPGLMVHSGFYSIYESMRADLLAAVPSTSTTLYITGHSLGGALASLCALDLSGMVPITQVYTFASPRIFNNTGAEQVNTLYSNTIYRIFNTEDIVPVLPLAVGFGFYEYEHCGLNIPFTSNLDSLTSNHCNAYLNYLNLG